MIKPTMNVKALQLESRFSLPPNSLGYCGKGSAPEKFKQCIITGSCEGVEEEVSHFIVLNPYLETLSKIFKLPKFSYEVIEAYWIGNDQLEKAKPEHYFLLLENFLKQGVPEWLVEDKDLDRIKLSPRVTAHDYDLGFQLKYLKKLGKVGDVKVIGIPMGKEADYNLIQSILRKLVAQDMHGS